MFLEGPNRRKPLTIINCYNCGTYPMIHINEIKPGQISMNTYWCSNCGSLAQVADSPFAMYPFVFKSVPAVSSQRKRKTV